MGCQALGSRGRGRASGDHDYPHQHFVESTPFFGPLLSNRSSISGCWVGLGAAAGFLGSDVDIPDLQKPRASPTPPAENAGQERVLEAPHLSSPGKATSRRESWPRVQPRAPPQPAPRPPPAQLGQPPGGPA